MPLKLFYNEMTPTSRAVLLTAKALDLDVELEQVHIFNKDQINQQLCEVNRQHTVPTLLDEDFVLCEAHAIAGYLVNKYASTDQLYPKDPKLKGLVDQHLHFDTGTLLPRVETLLNSIIVENEKEISTDKISAIIESYKYLNELLLDKKYLGGGEHFTIADLCCVATVSTATVITPISTEKYPSLSIWYRSCKNLPFYDEANGPGLNKLDALVELKLGRPRTKDFCE